MTGLVENGHNCNRNNHANGTREKKTEDEILLEPYNYICQVSNQDFWKKICKALQHWLKCPEDKFKLIDTHIQTVRNTTLLMDDIQDDADTREGIPTAHRVFGIPNTLNAYYYAGSTASEALLDLDNDDAIPLYKTQLLELCRHRRLVQLWRDTVTCPTEEQYRKLILKKTRGMAMSEVLILQLFSENKEDYSNLLKLLGWYFQLLDDYRRLTLDNNPESLTYARDVTLGNFTFPIIHAVRTNKTNGEVITSIMRQHTKDVELKKYVVALLQRHNSLEYTLEELRKTRQKVQQEVKRFPPNTLMDEFIKSYMII